MITRHLAYSINCTIFLPVRCILFYFQYQKKHTGLSFWMVPFAYWWEQSGMLIWWWREHQDKTMIPALHKRTARTILQIDFVNPNGITPDRNYIPGTGYHNRYYHDTNDHREKRKPRRVIFSWKEVAIVECGWGVVQIICIQLNLWCLWSRNLRTRRCILSSYLVLLIWFVIPLPFSCFYCTPDYFQLLLTSY